MCHKLISCAVIVLAATACTEPPALTEPQPSFIINGVPTGSAFQSVGALLFDLNKNGLNGDDVLCTGSLIAPTVFLTAAHCVVGPLTPPGTQFHVSFSPDLYAASFSAIAATGYVFDPQYGQQPTDPHDLAVVFLPSGSTTGIVPLNLPPAGHLTGLASKGGLAGETFVNVGYGASSTLIGPPAFPYDGTRKVSESKFRFLQAVWLGLLMNSNATGLGGDCYGDSGGPKFHASDLTVIVSVVTTGDLACRATSVSYRLDTPSARGFLGQFVTLP